jgi:membrane peptidoglycan carboxypeptidase
VNVLIWGALSETLTSQVDARRVVRVNSHNARPKTAPTIPGVIGALFGGLGLSVLAGVLVTAVAVPGIAVAGIAVNNGVGVFDTLPTQIAISQQPQQNRVFATSAGEPVQIATMFDQNREEVAWDQVSDFVKDAAVSGEDRRFFEHGGIDPTGIVRAAVTNVAAGGIAEGASTITQQYVKNTFVQAALELPEDEQAAAYEAAIDTSFTRKLQEMKLAISMEKEYTKEEILLAYLNIANFGGTTYGIEAAAQRYYNTSALTLTAAQSASLIAIVQSPTAMRLDTAENWERNTERRNVILDAMLSDGNLTAEQHTEAVAVVANETTVTLTEPSNGCRVANDYTRYFCDYITNLIPELTSLGADAEERTTNWRRGGYDVYTSLDLGLQVTAQNAVWANAPNDTTALELGAAAVSVEVGTGRILTMAQNKTYDNTGDADPTTTAVNFNTDRAYGGSSGFQPGSTYKVFTLLNWLENGHSINEVVNGSPRTIPQNQFTNSCDPSQVVGVPYEFGNDDGFGGNMPVRTAVQRSVNGAFMSMALELDLCEIKETAEKIGVHRADGGELGMTPASVLGTNEIAPLTMATAYAAIANEGVFCRSTAVDRVVAPDGAELPGQAPDCSEQLSAEVANTAAFAMASVMESGGTATRSNPNNGVDYIGKTGTTDSSNQTWVVGASTRVATAVWVGNVEGEYPMRNYRNNLGTQGGVIRHDVFRPIAVAVDATAEYRGGQFPEPSRALTATQRSSGTPSSNAPSSGTPAPSATPAPQR